MNESVPSLDHYWVGFREIDENRTEGDQRLDSPGTRLFTLPFFYTVPSRHPFIPIPRKHSRNYSWKISSMSKFEKKKFGLFNHYFFISK